MKNNVGRMKSIIRLFCDVDLQSVLLLLVAVASYFGHCAHRVYISVSLAMAHQLTNIYRSIISPIAADITIFCCVVSAARNRYYGFFITLARSRSPPLATVAVYGGPLCMQILPIYRRGVGTSTNAAALRHKRTKTTRQRPTWLLFAGLLIFYLYVL